MPQESVKENPNPDSSTGNRWHKFHFSGKIIICSVLFGLGLVLIGGLVMIIGTDNAEDSKTNNLEEIQSKAPMTVVGPIVIGIGGFTVIVGIVMCLFETNICRKRDSDVKPLIVSADAVSNNARPTTEPSTSQKIIKSRSHGKSRSPRKHKGAHMKSAKSKAKSKAPVCESNPSKPIDVERSSKDLSEGELFQTPQHSFASGTVSSPSDGENKSSASLGKSDRSFYTSAQYHTPSSSFHESAGSYEDRTLRADIHPLLPNPEEAPKNNFEDIKKEFLTPKNSNAEIIDAEFVHENDINNYDALQNQSSDSLTSALNQPIKNKTQIYEVEFVTPKDSGFEFSSETIKSNSDSQSEKKIANNNVAIIDVVTNDTVVDLIEVVKTPTSPLIGDKTVGDEDVAQINLDDSKSQSDHKREGDATEVESLIPVSSTEESSVASSSELSPNKREVNNSDRDVKAEQSMVIHDETPKDCVLNISLPSSEIEQVIQKEVV